MRESSGGQTTNPRENRPSGSSGSPRDEVPAGTEAERRARRSRGVPPPCHRGPVPPRRLADSNGTTGGAGDAGGRGRAGGGGRGRPEGGGQEVGVVRPRPD